MGGAGEKTGDTAPSQDPLQWVLLFPRLRRSRLFSVAGRGPQTPRSARGLPCSRPGPLSPPPRGPTPGPAFCAGETGGRRRAGRRQWARGGLSPFPVSVPVGLASVRGLRRSRPLLAAATP
ncbi:hypothetical protein NDU88_000346 [Pleurodeles waltl]|uniref:Uncharacterized protein n=1 Tax=Pleurodeles waltl TaxID=8319 RepID=A0AAV7P0S3_PLEWA|nr:hypothetical protein NDU88_000346 [Pleurodeles waltl]